MWRNNITLPITYVPIPDAPKLEKRRSLITLAFSFASAVTLLLVFLLLVSSGQPRDHISLSDHVPVHHRGVSEGVSEKSTTIFLSSDTSYPHHRGVSDGVSEKSTRIFLSSDTSYPWTNSMLSWQRTGFHFQPQKNWMNDPDAPLFYKGWYHLFYQYNPDSAVWGNISWGHAVSRDMINWRYLPLSMVPDHWYDINGVWTGSATILPNDQVIILYTGSTNTSTQVQNLAVPADPKDPLLVDWIKSGANPVLVPPPGIGQKDFRDPTSAWYVESTSSWRVAIGSKNHDYAGIVLVYETKDLLNYTLLPGVLHEVPGTGMWECVDFYPLRTEDGVKHVLKASFDDDKHDYYGLGVYDPERELWVPDDLGMDVGSGLRLDYGKYYASKSFYDGEKRRRVVWGWTGETDSERTDLMKGWASLQTIPRTVSYDNKTKSNLIQWPVEEVESLRLGDQEHTNITLPYGSILPIDLKYADQLDITAEFQIDSSTSLETTINEADVGYNCSTSNGSRERGLLGPFGLLVLADKDLIEQTAVYFYIARGIDGSLQTFFCQDELRSSKANDIVKRVYGSVVPVLNGESLSVRILVDHSIVESFAQGGRTCITSRVYPTRAIYGAARVFLFNNATNSVVLVRKLKIWQMNSATLRPYTEDEDHKTY